MQNRLAILALLGLSTVSAAESMNVNKPAAPQKSKPVAVVQKKMKAKDIGAMTVGAAAAVGGGGKDYSSQDIFALVNNRAAIHQDIRQQARKMDIEPPSKEAILQNMFVPAAEDIAKDAEGVKKLMKEVQTIGGDSGKKNKSATMTDADIACYSSRYSDIKDKKPKDHYRTTGDIQGRLGTCARDLTDYEALMYLHTFPELQQKFGDGASALKQARKHYMEIGYKQSHFSEKMKDTSKSAWKCGEGAKQSCKCHGTLWYGATVAPDDKKPIDSWEKMREWKTLSKESEEWMSCTDASFGGDPWADQEKQCWCEDKPAYKPWKCADEGDECLCDGGWVVYGAKAGADKKEMDFFGTIKLSLAITGTKGKKSISCESGSFSGADPAPDADKVCFCDAEKKFFDNTFVTATKLFWKSSQLEKQSEGELKRTTEHEAEVEKVAKEKEAVATETTTAAAVENEKAISDIQAAKQCAVQSIEESYKFRKQKIAGRKTGLMKTIEKRRAQVSAWQFQMNQKKAAAESSCVAAGRKGTTDKVRVEGECKRLTLEVEELATQIMVEIEKINEDERIGTAEIQKEETTLESKRTKETISVEEKADQDTNEINEEQTEKKLDQTEEKEQLLQQQAELTRIQQKQSHKIEGSIKEQQNAVNILISNLRKTLTKLARKEEVYVSELSDEAPERETVVNRIIERSKETVTKLTTAQTELKEKKTKIVDEQAKMKEDLKGLTEKLTGIQAKIVTSQENLKLKIAERTSKREILKTYGEKTGEKTPSAEGAIVTQGAIDKISTSIKELRESIKKNIQQKNEFFSTKLTTQKQSDLGTNQIKTIEVQIVNIKDFIEEVEGTIKTVELKIKEEIATKKVIETQKEAFKAAQKKTDAEEDLNSTRIVVETKKAEATKESKDCKKKFDNESAGVKALNDQLKTIEKAAGDSKGSKEEKARLDGEAEGLKKQVDEANKELDESKKICGDIDSDLAKVVEESSEKIKKLTTTIEKAKETQETAEKEAKAVIVTLPGGDEDKATADKKKEEEEKKEGPSVSTTSITISAGAGATKTTTSTGKPKPPSVPAPPKKEEDPPKAGEKPKPPPVPVTVSETTITKKKQLDSSTDDVDEDDGEPSDVVPTEVPGGEAQITKEVTENTLAAHNARVDLVKTKNTLKYELETIKATLTKFKETITKTTEEVKTNQTNLKSEQAKLESMKATAVTAKLKGTDKGKIEAEINEQVTKLTELETKISRQQASIIEWKAKIEGHVHRRKEIKYAIEIKVLEAKEAEAAVIEAIKTVTDVELLNRKRWIASQTVGDYKRCNKYMDEYKQIYDKQSQVIGSELNDHTRRIDVAEGAITSLKEKKKLVEEGKKTKDSEIVMSKIESEMERHEKVVTVEKKVVTAVKEKKEKNQKEYETHTEKCAKTKQAANMANSAVNDAATTLKNQREYQVQITNLKNVLIGSHEEAIKKREEAEKIHQNYTMMVAKYEQQSTITTEQVMESKTRIAAAQEIKRIISIREKEISTLLSRPTITASEKTKLENEEKDIKIKMETQDNAETTETKNLVNYEQSLAILSKTVDTFKGYIKDVKATIKLLEKKVSETKQALKAPKKEEKAPPVKGKDTEDEDAAEKDAEGDDKIDDIDEKEEEASAVKGGNEKVDKELDQVEEENKSKTTQIDSLTKTITTVQEKSEISNKEMIKEVEEQAKEEAEVAQIKVEKVRLERVRERQRCARLFPDVFSSYKIKKELTQENMCPCPNSGKGLTILYLENIKDTASYDKFILHLFEKNLAVEGTFEATVQKFTKAQEEKGVTSSEDEQTRIKLVVNDDKVEEVMQSLDDYNLPMRSTDFKLSPLLKGKNEYLKWQQAAVQSKTQTNHIHMNDMVDDDEEMDEEMTD